MWLVCLQKEAGPFPHEVGSFFNGHCVNVHGVGVALISVLVGCLHALPSSLFLMAMAIWKLESNDSLSVPILDSGQDYISIKDSLRDQLVQSFPEEFNQMGIIIIGIDGIVGLSNQEFKLVNIVLQH